jgi:predicted helicase
VGNSQTFADVLESLGTNSYSKGANFEHVVKWWLQNDEVWSKELVSSTVKLWHESSLRTGPDIGIDLTAEDFNGNVWAIQAKNWNSEATLPKGEIDKFLSASNTKVFQKRLLISTTNSISTNALRAIDEQEKPVTVILKSHLEDSFAWSSYSSLKKEAARSPKKKLYPHQSKAVQQVTSKLVVGSRGQLLMACGSGKTITALRIDEALGSGLTLVLLPSLLLVQQTLKSWRVEAVSEFKALSICSDSSVNGDETVSRVSDLPFPVTTDPKEIRKFLNVPGRKVIFSTYQSSEKVQQALAGTKQKFDLIVCDEAHRLAGKVDEAFGTVLRKNAIPSDRYLFMTATPKVFSTILKARAKENDIEIHSMDQEDKFGPVFFEYSFAEAIEQNVLMDYKVVVMGVNDASIRELVDNRDFLQFGNQVVDAATLAAHFGVAKAMRDNSIKRVITFHSRVERAKEFAELYPKVMSQSHGKPVRVLSEAISGKDPAFVRRKLLDKLKDLPGFDFGIVSNSRCLTEGVDVPSLDGVAFIDPRSSQVDIIQAVGRAIRKGGAEKKSGFIILPIFFPSQDLNEQRIDESQFKPVWQVLNALKSHDASLEEEINTLRRGLGRIGTKAQLPSKIVFDLPTGFPADFSEKITTYILEKTSSVWEEVFGKLERFSDAHGHARPRQSSKDPEELALAAWVGRQRGNFNVGQLSKYRAKKLESIDGWSWNVHETQWLEGYDRLVAYSKEYGTSKVPGKYQDEEGYLGVWLSKLRGKKSELSNTQRDLLEKLPEWSWDPLEDDWEESLSELRKLALEKGNTRYGPDARFASGRSIRAWVGKQREVKASLTEDQVARLEAITGWSWDPFADANSLTRAELLKYVEEFGTSKVPHGYKTPDGFLLGSKVQNIRQSYRMGTIKPEMKKFVTGLPGWVWKTSAKD